MFLRAISGVSHRYAGLVKYLLLHRGVTYAIYGVWTVQSLDVHLTNALLTWHVHYRLVGAQQQLSCALVRHRLFSIAKVHHLRTFIELRVWASR